MMNEPIQESAAAATGAPAAAAVPSFGGPGGPAGLDAASMISMLGTYRHHGSVTCRYPLFLIESSILSQEIYRQRSERSLLRPWA